VGILRRDGAPADASAVERMLARILHRGPDGRGRFADGEVALGHLRLAILDPSERARQPIETPDGRGVLVYNGEVYNYRELRGELERQGARFASSGDSEVVLQALHRWGPARAIPRFDGMFALAYFDLRERALWLARDRLGIKPLYVAERGTELIFGSEPSALLAHPDLACRPDRLAIASFVIHGRSEGRATPFEGLKAFEPGTWWRADRRAIERHRYFHVLDDLDVGRLRAADARGATERFEKAFAESVRLHLASDAPLAAVCSGGVDSSLVAAHASRHVRDLRGYVADVDFAGGEGERAQRAADHLGIALERVRVDRESYLRLWPEAILFDGYPSTHRSNAALLAVARAARADGVKVLLNGEGSDELFGGYEWHAHAFDAQRLAATPWRRAERRRRRRRRFHPLPGTHALGNRGIAALDGDAELRRRALYRRLAPLASPGDRAFHTQSLDDLYAHLAVLLRRHDRMAMAASVEMRVPFLENRLIDLALHLPRRAKLRRGRGKWVVKRAARRFLPREIVDAPKRGFPMPAEFDAGSEQLLRGGVAAELFDWTARTRDGLVSMLRRDERLRFPLVSVELWGRIHLRGEKPEALAEQLLAAAR
jgi:asparagine synthase (glutamine-hydrolysing)